MTEAAVRLAVPADRDGLVQHCHMIHDENGLFALSERKVGLLLDRYFDRQGAIIGVIGEEGEPQGSIYLSIDEPYYSDDCQLTELWNFVMPSYRGGKCLSQKGGHAKRLIAFAKDCSDKLKLPLAIGILSNQRVEAKERLYERQLERAGSFFVYNRQFAGGTAWDRMQG